MIRKRKKGRLVSPQVKKGQVTEFRKKPGLRGKMKRGQDPESRRKEASCRVPIIKCTYCFKMGQNSVKNRLPFKKVARFSFKKKERAPESGALYFAHQKRKQHKVHCANTKKQAWPKTTRYFH